MNSGWHRSKVETGHSTVKVLRMMMMRMMHCRMMMVMVMSNEEALVPLVETVHHRSAQSCSHADDQHSNNGQRSWGSCYIPYIALFFSSLCFFHTALRALNGPLHRHLFAAPIASPHWSVAPLPAIVYLSGRQSAPLGSAYSPLPTLVALE